MGTAQIPLTQSQVALVDSGDFDRLSASKWYAQWHPGTNSFRAVRMMGGRKHRKMIYMHRAVLEMADDDRRVVDHINHDTLDNRRVNLRPATFAENVRNSRLRADNKCGLKGIYFHKASGLWHSRIKVDGRTISLGYFHSAKEAHEAYCAAAKIHHGEFARTL